MWLQIDTLIIPLSQGKVRLGRAGDNDIVLRQDVISRHHLEIIYLDGRVSFETLKGAAAPLLLGKPLQQGHLNPNDQLTIGFHTLTLLTDLPASGRKKMVSQEVDWQPFAEFLTELGKTSDTKALLEKLLLGVVEAFSAERGFVLLGDRQEFKKVASYRLDNDDSITSVSSTVYREAIKAGKTLVIDDSTRDARCVNAPSLSAHDAPRTILCGPLQTDEMTFGVLYVDKLLSADDIPLHLFSCALALASRYLSASRTRERLMSVEGALGGLSEEHHLLIKGGSEDSKRLQKLIDQAAPQDVTVLITGDTGTGKEVVARSIHHSSPRRRGPFVAVNCSALSPSLVEAELFGAEKGAFTGASERRVGRFEMANEGTLFLDEIGELPKEVQVKLLRVLQERTIIPVGGNKAIALDFRLLCATNADLEKSITEGTFRRDLFYRINVFRIRLSPLVERSEDILPLARHFLSIFTLRLRKEVTGFSTEAEDKLMDYQWPGNVRELRNAIERAVVVEEEKVISASSLPIGQSSALLAEEMPLGYTEAKDSFERAFFQRALKRAKGNISALARETGITRFSVYRHLERLGLGSRKQ